MPNKLRDFFIQPNSLHARPLTRRIVLGLAFFSLFMIVLSTDFIPKKIALQVGQVSDHDVIAPRTVSYVDPAKTKKLEEEVLASVASVYDFDVAVTARADETVGAIFRVARAVANDPTLSTPEERMEKLQAVLPVSLPSTALSGLANLDGAGLNTTEEQAKNILRKYLQRGVREGDLEIARKQNRAGDREPRPRQRGVKRR